MGMLSIVIIDLLVYVGRVGASDPGGFNAEGYMVNLQQNTLVDAPTVVIGLW